MFFDLGKKDRQIGKSWVGFIGKTGPYSQPKTGNRPSADDLICVTLPP